MKSKESSIATDGVTYIGPMHSKIDTYKVKYDSR